MRSRVTATLGVIVIMVGTFGVLASPSVAARADELIIGPGATLSAQRAEADEDVNRDENDNKVDLDQDDETTRPQAGPSLHYGFGLRARRQGGQTIMQLGGPAISLCSVHGQGAVVDFATEAGNSPLQTVQCGRAFGMDVHLNGCTADIEYHGFVHSDRAQDVYLGMMTTDIHFTKTGPTQGLMRVTTFTPKRPIVLEGRVTTPSPITMATCP